MTDIVVSNHAKKRIRQRVHKNYQKAAEDAWEFGLKHNELSGGLKKYVDKIAMNSKSRISSYKVFHQCVYLFAGNELVTVLHLPRKFLKAAQRLTSQKMERL